MNALDLNPAVAAVLAALLFLPFASAGGAAVSGGNVSNLLIDASVQTGAWAGVYGWVATGAGAVGETLYSGNVSNFTVVFPLYCTGGDNFLLASNSSTLDWSALAKGEPAALDSLLGFTGNESDSANQTFNASVDYAMGSQVFLGANATYTFSQSLSPGFDEGLLVDSSSGAFVFVTRIHAGELAFSGEPADFQLLLPVVGGVGANESYYFYGSAFNCPVSTAPLQQGGAGGVNVPYSPDGGGAGEPTYDPQNWPGKGWASPTPRPSPAASPSPLPELSITGVLFVMEGGDILGLSGFVARYWSIFVVAAMFAVLIALVLWMFAMRRTN